MDQKFDISLITINYHGWQDTCDMIASIPTTRLRMEVIVVDNGSGADETDKLDRWLKEWQGVIPVSIVKSAENLGFAGGNNLGISKARGRLLFLLNNDTLLHHTDIDRLAKRVLQAPHIGGASPLICDADANERIQYAGYTPLSSITLRNHAIGWGERRCQAYSHAHPTPYLHGAAMMVRREAINRAGLMPTCYFLYYEELDWSLMLRRAGYELWFEPQCLVHHKESRSTGTNSPLKAYYLSRNRLLFARRNLTVPKRWLAYAYQLAVVTPHTLIRQIATDRNRSLARATLQGIQHFLCRSSKQYTPQYP